MRLLSHCVGRCKKANYQTLYKFALFVYNTNMKISICAKLNLTLNVFGKQGKFHPIDSIATTVDICDVITVTKRCDSLVTVTGVQCVEQTQNTAYKVATAFCKQFGTNGVDIAIDKGIPFGGGLGGSSADGSGVLYCMCALFGIPLTDSKVADICSQVGSDLTFLLHGGLGRLTGKGDDVTYGKLAIPLYFAVTTFDKQISTADAYNGYDSNPVNGKADNDAIWAQLTDGKLLPQMLFNNLQLAVSTADDYARNYLAFCAKHNLPTTMTGSGSAYFIPFDNKISAQVACKLLQDNGFATSLCHSTDSSVCVLEY